MNAQDGPSLVAAISSLCASAKPGDYVAIQAYLDLSGSTGEHLQSIRLALRGRLGLATTVGLGPRFLHSTGQLHKGGPNTGLFLQLVDDPAQEVPVPETDYTFKAMIRAQALGDYQALIQRGRRVLRVNVGRDAPAGLESRPRGDPKLMSRQVSWPRGRRKTRYRRRQVGPRSSKDAVTMDISSSRTV